MALDHYEGPGRIWLGSNALAEAQTLRWSVNGNNRRVYTMKKGLAGRARGPIEGEITVENAVPISGLEDDYVEKIVDNADVRVTFEMGGKLYSFDGWIDMGDGEQGTEAASRFSFTVIVGKPRILNV